MLPQDRYPKAPDYTNAALLMGLINLLWIFGVVWALFGLPVVVALGWVLDRAIGRLVRRRRAGA